MDTNAIEEYSEERLKKMVAEIQVDSYAQPIVDLYSGEVFGYEMLARGTGPFFSPEYLFAKAEELGISAEVEMSCRMAALQKITSFSEELLQNKHFFINISPDIFNDPDFQEEFTVSSVDSLGLDPSKIVMEITETAAVDDFDDFEKIVRYYMSQGFHIAVDDFGSGHSGLITLVTVTPDFMKIDKEIIRGIDQNSYKQKLLQAITTFSDSVGSNVIAEGVETWNELKTVFRLGIRYVQGFLLGKPEPSPQPIPVGIVNELKSLIADYRHHQYSVDISASRMVIYPHVLQENSKTCREVEADLRRNRSISHLVVLSGQQPVGLITRDHFYSIMSGQYGYAVYAEKSIQELAKTEMLIGQEEMDLRILSKLAMARDQNDLYDPIVLTNDRGELTGTITMQQLLLRAFDTEIRLAASANPLTGLPGNMIIGDWLSRAVVQKVYTVVYFDLDKFKEYNDCYGYAAGDDMIKLLAQILVEFSEEYEGKVRIGHIGGDDFIAVADIKLGESEIMPTCRRFDDEKLDLFSTMDIDRGYYMSVNRIGATVKSPLVTLSASIITSENYATPPHPGQIGQTVAILKKEIKIRNAKTGKSGCIADQRRYDFANRDKPCL